MTVIPPYVPVLIAAIAMLISGLALIFARRDKGEERASRLEKSHKDALDRVETAFNTRMNSSDALQNERHRTNSDRLQKIDQEVSAVQEALKHIPTHRDINGLQQSMSGLCSQVSKVEGLLEANTRTTERINQFLLDRGA